MASFLNTLYLWTIKENVIIKDGNIGCLVYHDKSEIATDQQYSLERQNFFESRGNVWTITNKRPERLKDNLKELQDICMNYRCINVEWKTRHVIQAIFNNGTFVYFFINISTGDLEKISIDKFLIGKLYSEHIVDVIQNENSIIFSYVEPKLTHVQLSKKPFFIETNKKWEKISSLSPKITTIDLIGPTGRRLERYLSCNVKHNLLLLWWRTSNDEVWPWTPLSTDKERANIHLYSMNGQKFELVSYCRTEGEPMSAAFSKTRVHLILILEQKTSHSGEIFAERCIYEVTVSKLQRAATALIPLSSPIVCQEQNPQEDKILIACTDGSLVMFDDYRRTTQTTKTAFTSTVIAWHPSGCLVLVSSNKGEILCFDQGLSSIHFQLLAEELIYNNILNISEFFRCQPKMAMMIWNPPQLSSPEASYYPTSDNLILVIDKGPFALLKMHLGVLNRSVLSSIDLITQYIKHSQIDEAINLLGSLNWNNEGDTCYFNLMMIVNYLLRRPLTATTEAQLEAALGTFYAPLRPLSKITILEYRDRVRNLARRFFHHLLRFKRLEKASLLAIDIGSSDLFRDLYHVAVETGDMAIAEMALKNAEGLGDSFESETVDDSNSIIVLDSSEAEDSGDNYSESSFSSEYSNHSPSTDKNVSSSVHKNSQMISQLESVVQNSKQFPYSNVKSHNLTSSLKEMAVSNNSSRETNQEIVSFPSVSQSQLMRTNKKSTPLFSSKKIISESHSGDPYLSDIKQSFPSTFVQQDQKDVSAIPSQSNNAIMTNFRNDSTEASISIKFSRALVHQDQYLNAEKSHVSRNENVHLDPNEQFVDCDSSSEVESGDEGTGQVKVVHFGIV